LHLPEPAPFAHGQKGFSGRRQLNTVGTAMYQRNADFLFEIPDLPAERWLRRVQLLLAATVKLPASATQ